MFNNLMLSDIGKHYWIDSVINKEKLVRVKKVLKKPNTRNPLKGV